MTRFKKLLYVILVLLLIVAFVFTYILVSRNRKVQTYEFTNEGDESLVVDPNNSPLVKYYPPEEDGGGIAYKIYGNFPDGVENAKNGFLTGNFVLEGDTPDNSIIVLMGNTAGQFYIGTHQGSLANSGSYQNYPKEGAEVLIERSDMVMITIIFRPDVNGEFSDYQLKVAKEFDDYISGDDKVFPANFGIAVQTISVVI